MGAHLTSTEGRALYGLLAETADEIVLKTDSRGFVVHATPAIERLGFALPRMLFGPHLAELALPGHRDRVRAALEAALGDPGRARQVEFAARMGDGRDAWFEIKLRSLFDEASRSYGAIGMMRSIDERRLLEEQLFAATLTDPLTGLTNRQAFLAMLGHLAGHAEGGCLALFSIDHFKAINLRYGEQTGDRLLIAFADFLRAALRSGDIISRIGNQRFAVLLPATGQMRSAAVCERVIENLSMIGGAQAADGLPITASAGVATISGSVDGSLRNAELALFLARAKGRNRIEAWAADGLSRAA